MQNKFLLLISLLFGFFITYHFNYTKRSSNSFQEAILVVDQACFHIHHYMWLSVVVACILIGRYMHNDKIIAPNMTNIVYELEKYLGKFKLFCINP